MSTILSGTLAYHYRLAEAQSKLNQKKNNNSYYNLHAFDSKSLLKKDSPVIVSPSSTRKKGRNYLHQEHLCDRSMFLDLQEVQDEDDDDLVVFVPLQSSSLKLKKNQGDSCCNHDARDERLKLRKTNESGIHQKVYSRDQSRNHYAKHDDDAHLTSSVVAPSTLLSSSSSGTQDKVIENLLNNHNLRVRVSTYFGVDIMIIFLDRS